MKIVILIPDGYLEVWVNEFDDEEIENVTRWEKI